MMATLTIVRYPKRYIYFALLSMALFRLPLWLNKRISFFKLLGCGKNGKFVKDPDWQQWGIFSVTDQDLQNLPDTIKYLYGGFIHSWFTLFRCERWTIILEPIQGYGKWDGKEPFGKLAKQSNYEDCVAVLTRATIRISKLRSFWNNVDAVAVEMAGAKGFITAIGIGELPYIKQATFSIWKDIRSMEQFAYETHPHSEVIQKTRKENWFSEDMFIRFKPIKTTGTLKGINPLTGK